MANRDHLPTASTNTGILPLLKSKLGHAQPRDVHFPEDATPAAVLAPLFLDEVGELQVWVLRKSASLRKHAHQIALPGGKHEPDDQDMLDTALREAHEEIGLPRGNIELVGALPRYLTWTNYAVTPYVGLLREPFDPVADPVEVARVFTLPLRPFAEEPTLRPVPYLTHRGEVPSYVLDGELIWGATAAILRELARLLT